MPKFISGEYRVCISCGAPMRKLPYLTDIYMCEQCQGFRYRLPEEWELPAADEDETLYREETSGE